jgi:hypothetical protein
MAEKKTIEKREAAVKRKKWRNQEKRETKKNKRENRFSRFLHVTLFFVAQIKISQFIKEEMTREGRKDRKEKTSVTFLTVKQ